MEVVYWQHCLGVAWLVPCEMLPFRREFCVHHSSMHQVTASLHSKPHRQGVCVFSRNLPPALLAEWLGSFRCYCGDTGVEHRYRNKASAQKADKEFRSAQVRSSGPSQLSRLQHTDPQTFINHSPEQFLNLLATALEGDVSDQNLCGAFLAAACLPLPTGLWLPKTENLKKIKKICSYFFSP